MCLYHRVKRIAHIGVILASAGVLLLPLVTVLAMSITAGESLGIPSEGLSFRWYITFFQDPRWVRSFLNSLRLATASSIIAAVIGVPFALGVSKFRPKAQAASLTVLAVPLVFPLVVTGTSLVFFFSGSPLPSFFRLVAAHTLLGIPVIALPMTIALARLDPRLYWQARSLGASAIQANLRVLLPAVWPALVVGLGFAFVTSFDEVVLAIFLADSGTETLPKLLWESLRFELTPTAAAASSLSLLFTITLAVSLTLSGATNDSNTEGTENHS